MKNGPPLYYGPTFREERGDSKSDDSNNNDLHILKDEESVDNISFPELSVESIASEELRNPVLNKITTCDTIDSPIRLDTSEQKPCGFSSLKTETFDNNFKDIHRLKRKHELLALSKRTLYSKLYTPKLEALQRLVEPGKYLINNHFDYQDKNLSTSSYTNYKGYLPNRLDLNNSESLTKADDIDPLYTFDSRSDTAFASSNRNTLSDLNSNFDFLDFEKITKESREVSFGDAESFNKPQLDSFQVETYTLNEHSPRSEYKDNYKSITKRQESVEKSDVLEKTKQQTPNILTLKSCDEYVNGRKKKRVQIPVNAYKSTLSSDGSIDKSHKIVLKFVSHDSEDFDYEPKNLLELIEERLESIANSTELYGDKIINPEFIIEQLESLRPPNMDRELFLLLCLKPIGMGYNEYFKIFSENDFAELLNQLYNFNLLNTNAMGYVLDAEYEILKEFNRLGRIHQKLINEDIIYSKILATMQENFMSQAEDLLKTTRQDLRLEVGYSHLRWGRIKNVLSWKPGDPILREKGFVQDMASTIKMKTLQRMEQAFGTQNAASAYSPSSQLPANEAHYIYYIKTLQSLEETEQEMLQLQVSRDRMQTLSEFSVIGPYHKPENSLPWKCIGLSCNSVVWKMYNTVECTPIVYKFRTLNDITPEEAKKLGHLYNSVLDKLKELKLKVPKKSQILFSNSVKVHKNCVVEQIQFIKHSPFSLLLEKSSQFNSSERLRQTQVVIREVIRMVNYMKDLKFILPLKSSRIYFNNGGVILSGGSLLGTWGVSLLKKHSVQTIATLLWGKNIEWYFHFNGSLYLPPESEGDPSYTQDPLMVSKAHTWMIGKLLYESICLSTTNKNELDYSKIELCEHEDTKEFMKICLEQNPDNRPTIEALMALPYLKKVKLNYGTFVPMDVPKVRCAVEFLGDIETIVLNKMRKTEKGVADYEQYDEGEIKFVESNG
ncbi:LOW QUALITY PROTEIN: uncharacterized protein TA19460 [Theileria annulata]|uniref:Protein kinase domain-containing protein n=1 Tax=Theileria annulata TaxID=5874 RepID=Q4UGG0_THEAN|nr:LOW QUALITY PROTEIN: uncharacterized protein TA19460 [Theileria annulata]CAI73829.1 hypothetical protein TA19460 [Theileria annulata]|eukprot:XP_954506.1 LOW QUALITY PROTEIN: hypothetical protein TA19460 [Theileria annulata]